MQEGMAAQIAAADVDPTARQDPPVARRLPRRRTVLFVGTGVVAYLLALVATLPARAVIAGGDNLRVGGTIWNGEAVLAHTLRVDWGFAPLKSLTRLGFSADWHIAGGGTDLGGSATQRGEVFSLYNVAGQADSALLNAFAPNFPLACDFVADVAIDEAELGGDGQHLEGTMRTGAVDCTARNVPAPPLRFAGLEGRIVPRGDVSTGYLASIDTRTNLIEIRLSEAGLLSVWPAAPLIQRAPVLSGQRFDQQID